MPEETTRERGGVATLGHPAFALIFHVFRRFLGDGAAVVALDDAESEIDSRGEPAGGGDFSVLDIAEAALHVNLRKTPLQSIEGLMMRGGGLAVEQSGLCQLKRASADGGNEIRVGGRRDFFEPTDQGR